MAWLIDDVVDGVAKFGKGTFNYLDQAGKGVAGAVWSVTGNPIYNLSQYAGDLAIGAYNSASQRENEPGFLSYAINSARENILRDIIGVGEGGSEFGMVGGEYGLLQGSMKILPAQLWESWDDTMQVIDDSTSFIMTLLASGQGQEESLWYSTLPPELKDLANQGILKYDPFSDDERERLPEGISTSIKDRIPFLSYADPETYKQAYAISFGEEERSFGQALAVLHSGIDPFSEQQYNRLEGTVYFNVLSGVADFAQEIFMDPLFLASPAIKLARGQSALVKATGKKPFSGSGIEGYAGFGDVGVVHFQDLLAGRGTLRTITPNSRVYVIGGDGMKKFHVIKNQPNQKRSRFAPDLIPPKTITVDGVPVELNYQGVAKNITQQRARTFVEHSAEFRMMNQVLDEAVPAADFSPNYQLSHQATAEDLILIDKRVGALRESLTSRQAKKLPQEALYALARANSPQARAKTMRLLMGDVSVVQEAMGAAVKAFDEIHTGTYYERWRQAQGLTDQVNMAKTNLTEAQSKLAKAEQKLSDLKTRSSVPPTKAQKNQMQLLMNDINKLRDDVAAYSVESSLLGKQSATLTSQLRKESQMLIDTDWLTVFDLHTTLRQSIVKEVVSSPTGANITPIDILKSTTGEEMALTKIIISDVLDFAARSQRAPLEDLRGVSNLGLVSELAPRFKNTRPGQKIVSAGRTAADKINITFPNSYAENAYNLGEKLRNFKGDYVGDVYNIPTTFKLLGSQKLTYFTQRVNQRLMHFYDPAQSFAQWERMLTYANKFEVNGKKFIEADEVQELVGRWTRMQAEGVPMSGFISLFNEVTQDLARRANDLITSETNIRFYKGDQEVRLDDQLIASSKEYDSMLRQGSAVDSSYPDPKFSVNNKETTVGNNQAATTFVFKNQADEVIAEVHHGLSPIQMAQSLPMPRWDLLEDAINAQGRFNQYKVFKPFDRAMDSVDKLKIGDIRKVRKAAQRAVITNNIAPAWTATTLLTPRWAMRVVGVDEQLRYMAVFGAMSKILGGPNSWKMLKQGYAAKGLRLSDDFIQTEMVDALKRRKIDVPENSTVADLNDLLAANDVDWTDIVKSAEKRAKKKLAIERSERTFAKGGYDFRTGLGMAARLGITGLVHPFAGLAHAGKYWRHRYKSLNKHMEMVGAQQIGDSYLKAGREMLGKADPENIGWLEIANQFMYEGAVTKDRLLRAANEQGVGIKNIDDIVDTFEAADTFMALAGQPTLRFGDNMFQNAMGDTMTWQKMNADMASARRSDMAAMRGAYNSNWKEISDYQKPFNIETYDFTDARLVGGKEKFEDVWATHYNQWHSRSPETKEFFEIVWDNTSSVGERKQAIVNLLENNPEIRNRIPNASTPAPSPVQRPTQTVKDYWEHIAERAISEADSMIPPGLVFNGLRRAAARGERVTWSQIDALLDGSNIRARLGLGDKYVITNKNTGATRQATDTYLIKNTKTNKTRQSTVRPDSGSNEKIVKIIRPSLESGETITKATKASKIRVMEEMRLTQEARFNNFAKHNGQEGIFSANAKREAATAKMEATAASLFETLGTMPSNQLSRHPFFQAKYQQYLGEQVTAYQNLDGNYVFTPRQKQKMEQIARRRALEDTRDTLYDLVEHTRFAEAVGFMSPFFNAWQEVFGRWAGLAFENPVFVGRGARIFTSDADATMLGIVQTEDEFGTPKVVFSLPDSLLADVPGFMELVRNDTFNFGPLGAISELVDNGPIAFDKYGLFGMFQSVTPGTGPLLTFAAQEALYHNPSWEEQLGFMFPFGVSSGNFLERLSKEILPSYAESIAFRTGKIYGNDQYQTRANKIFVDMMTKITEQNLQYSRGEAGYIDITDPLVIKRIMADATQMAVNFGTFKTFSNVLIPVAVEQMSPYYPLLKDYKDMREEDIANGYSSANPEEMVSAPNVYVIQDEYGAIRHDTVRPSLNSTEKVISTIEGRKLQGTEFTDNRFLAENGDQFFWLTQRMTDSGNAAGQVPTVEGWKLYEANETLIEAYPVIGAFLAQEVGDSLSENFSSVVYNKQKNENLSGTDEPMRSVKTLQEMYEQGDEREGWRKYRHGLSGGQMLTELVDGQGNPEIMYMQKDGVTPIPFDPEKGFRIQEHKVVVNGVEVFDPARTYYYNGEGMDDINQQLAIRGKYGLSTSINHKENRDLLAARDFIVEQIGLDHPMWKDAYTTGTSSTFMKEVMEGFEAMFEHPDDPWKGNGASVDLIQYIAERQKIEKGLLINFEAGGSADITAAGNEQLLIDWAMIQTEFANRPAFASTFQRYFSNDMVPRNSWTIGDDYYGDEGMYGEDGLDVLLDEARAVGQ